LGNDVFPSDGKLEKSITKEILGGSSGGVSCGLVLSLEQENNNTSAKRPEKIVNFFNDPIMVIPPVLSYFGLNTFQVIK
jgi:hypothetical protein